MLTYGLGVACPVLLIGLIALIVDRRNIRQKPAKHAKEGGCGPQVAPEALSINTDLVARLLRSVAPTDLVRFLDASPTQAVQELDRLLVMFRNTYEPDLQMRLPDGNAYLALARTHAATVILAQNVALLAEITEGLEDRALTIDRVRVVAATIVVTILALLAGLAGAVFAGLAIT